MGHSVARLAAVLAVALAAIVLIVVVSSSLSGGGEEKRSGERKTQTQEPKEDSYVVEPGDTLESISDKTGVPVDVLQQLNEDLDPQALPAGKELDLK
jgi:LysM repeat protein